MASTSGWVLFEIWKQQKNCNQKHYLFNHSYLQIYHCCHHYCCASILLLLLLLLLQWRAPNGVLPCRWYVAREHNRWPFSKLSGYHCLPTVHWHQSPSARWYAGALEVSSSLLVVGATHWQLGDDLAWNLNVPRGQRSEGFALMILETGGQLVVSLTEPFATCWISILLYYYYFIFHVNPGHTVSPRAFLFQMFQNRISGD